MDKLFSQSLWERFIRYGCRFGGVLKFLYYRCRDTSTHVSNGVGVALEQQELDCYITENFSYGDIKFEMKRQ